MAFQIKPGDIYKVYWRLTEGRTDRPPVKIFKKTKQQTYALSPHDTLPLYDVIISACAIEKSDWNVKNSQKRLEIAGGEHRICNTPSSDKMEQADSMIET